MQNGILILCAAALLIVLLNLERKKLISVLFITKMMLSSLFVLSVLVNAFTSSYYYGMILVGLLCCLGGDLFLAVPHHKAFIAGLVAFLFGHIFYILAFAPFAQFTMGSFWGSMVIILASSGVFLWLKPYLGAMRLPVFFYVVAISIMMMMASAAFANSYLNFNARIMILVGALSFYLSDIFVARNRFIQNAFINRLVGLPLYYAGQFLIAFSVGVLK